MHRFFFSSVCIVVKKNICCSYLLLLEKNNISYFVFFFLRKKIGFLFDITFILLLFVFFFAGFYCISTRLVDIDEENLSAPPSTPVTPRDIGNYFF